MASRANCWGWVLRSFAGAAIIAGAGLSGCNKHDKADGPRTAAETPAEPRATKENQPVAPALDSALKSKRSAFGDCDPLHQPFARAVRGPDDPPPGSSQPPDETLTGKPTFALLRQVKVLWETIRFTTPDGKPIEYTAVVETEDGNFDITLRQDVAPNHVRSFVALAKAGY